MKVFFLFISLSIAACAYSPQQLTIDPQIDGSMEVFGGNRIISVVVEDRREHRELGTRGGVYENTSTISLANDLSEAVASAARAKLASQGFSVSSAGEEQATLKIIIDKLSYDMPSDEVVKKVLLEAVLRAELSYRDKTFIGNYKTESTRQTVIIPTMGQNERMVNDVLSDTLKRLFTDPKLRAFLSNY